jgi:DNA-binding transcriptional LysR family regulator
MTVCLYVFPALLKQFRRAHPRVDVKVGTGPTGLLLDKLRSGVADLALLTLPIDDRTLASTPVVREELMLVAAPSHPIARRRRIAAEDLGRQAFVLYEPGSNTRRVIDEFFVKAGIEPAIVTETENVEIIKALVRIGLGITIIPYQAVAREVRAGYLFCARIAGQQLVRETGWVYRCSTRVPRTIQEMMRMLDVVVPRLKLAPPPGRSRSTAGGPA